MLERRLDNESERGLMVYYYADVSIDNKVESLFLDVEVHGGKLWAAATMELNEPLTPDEIDSMKDYLSGQYSDGFGEGFEQRGISVDYGELHVGLWSDESEFYIVTEQEFIQRFEQEKSAYNAMPTLTEKLYSPLDFYIWNSDTTTTWREEVPSKMILQFKSDIDVFMSENRMRYDTYDNNRGLMDYDGPESFGGKVHSVYPAVEEHSGRLWLATEVRLTEPLTPDETADLKYWWVKQINDGWGGQVNQLEINTSLGEMILDPQTEGTEFFIDTAGEFKRRLENETPAQAALWEPNAADDPETAMLRLELIERLDGNLSDYFDTLRNMESQEIAEMSLEIGVRMNAHYYLSVIHNFHASELNYLMQFQNPLEVAADEFLTADADENRSDIMWNIFHEQNALRGDYPLVRDETTKTLTPEQKTAEIQEKPLMEVKLYSPVFCDMLAYGEFTWRGDGEDIGEIDQREAAQYIHEIHEALLNERLPEEAERGLMTYYDKTDSVNEKVRSLFVDVEVHDSKLWAVATLKVMEPLTPEEFKALRSELTGQYSDGFGEGFEQREVKVIGGELNVHLWKYGDFFIDTQEQFAQRLGIDLPPDVLSQKAAIINGSAVIPEAEAHDLTGLINQLRERSEQNWEDYRHAPHETTPDNLFHVSMQVISRRDAAVFIKEYADFTAEQLNCLLQFANPVELVADYLDKASDISEMPGIMANILEEQENFKKHYALMPEEKTSAFEELKQQLIDRLADNYAVYKRDIFDLSKDRIFSAAAEILPVQEAYEYFTQEHNYLESDVDFLLKFENPLELISDKWSDRMSLTQTIDAIFIDQERTLQNGGYTLVSDNPAPTVSKQERNTVTDDNDKLSVIDRIRQAEKDAKERVSVPKDKSNHKKSREEL